jgi:copper chaperone CopZ
MMTQILDIQGMSCDHCARAVRQALSSLEGVRSVQVDLGQNQARLEVDRPLAEGDLRRAVEKAGYVLAGVR